MVMSSTRRRSAWIAAGLLATISLVIATTAAFAQEAQSPTATAPDSAAPANQPVATVAQRAARVAMAPGASRGVNRVQTPDSSSAATRQVDASKPEDARDPQKMVPESARDPQVMVPESARDPQVMVPESAHD